MDRPPARLDATDAAWADERNLSVGAVDLAIVIGLIEPEAGLRSVVPPPAGLRVQTMRFDRRCALALVCGALGLGAVIGVSALNAGLANRPADAAEGASVKPVSAYDPPNPPGRR